jgi:hypothetical protein
VAICVFVPLLICEKNGIIDLGSFIGGLLAYIGTASLGVVAVWQNERLNDLNSEYQEKLVKSQINYSNFIDFKKSVTEAVTSFDVHKLVYSLSHSTSNSANGFIEELSQMQSDIRKAQMSLLLNTDFNNDLEKEPCFTCEKCSAEYKSYIKATVNFRKSYNSIFDNVMLIITKLIKLLDGLRSNKVNDEIIRNYSEMLTTISTINESNNKKIDIEPYKKEKERLEKEKIDQEKLFSLYSNIVELLDKVADEYIQGLSFKAKVYIAALNGVLANPQDKKEHKDCKKRKKFFEKFRNDISEEYSKK